MDLLSSYPLEILKRINDFCVLKVAEHGELYWPGG
ncbi:hypothetical protein MNBD_GAMMA11-2326 [hydrothermal vent metagenome]|uniref:Uncharacterized protein n=1 Tax=hydrothermal vent metagenome TaxID=652676 RepID=A0A3B0X4I2_9ZZZZ